MMVRVDSWEARMAQRAAARARAEWEREQGEAAERARAGDAALAEEQRAEFEAGPPGGCQECWAWVRDIFGLRYSWVHHPVGAPYICSHACHGVKPYDVGAPVVIG